MQIYNWNDSITVYTNLMFKSADRRCIYSGNNAKKAKRILKKAIKEKFNNSVRFSKNGYIIEIIPAKVPKKTLGQLINEAVQ